MALCQKYTACNRINKIFNFVLFCFQNSVHYVLEGLGEAIKKERSSCVLNKMDRKKSLCINK